MFDSSSLATPGTPGKAASFGRQGSRQGLMLRSHQLPLGRWHLKSLMVTVVFLLLLLYYAHRMELESGHRDYMKSKKRDLVVRPGKPYKSPASRRRVKPHKEARHNLTYKTPGSAKSLASTALFKPTSPDIKVDRTIAATPSQDTSIPKTTKPNVILNVTPKRKWRDAVNRAQRPVPAPLPLKTNYENALEHPTTESKPRSVFAGRGRVKTQAQNIRVYEISDNRQQPRASKGRGMGASGHTLSPHPVVRFFAQSPTQKNQGVSPVGSSQNLEPGGILRKGGMPVLEPAGNLHKGGMPVLSRGASSDSARPGPNVVKLKQSPGSGLKVQRNLG